MTYGVNIVNATNPDGAKLSINGAPLVATSGGSSITYTLDANKGQQVSLALERGLNPNIYSYEGIQIVFQSLCDESISDTVTVNAHFVEPCSKVNISSPQNNWVLTPAANGVLSFTLDGYDETDTDLDLIRVQYRKVGAANWINIKDIARNALGATFTSLVWTVGNLPDDSYEVRAISLCLNGIPAGFSDEIPGKIERNPPEILGSPQPSDGIFNVGDEISVTFTEVIDCGAIFYADQFNLNNIGLYDKTTSTLVNANVQCVGNKITITPSIPTIFLENHTLEVRITGIKDLAGNVMGNDKTGSPIHKWEFYVNVSPIGWVGTNVEEVKLIAKPHSFQRTISNTGGNNVNYSIVTPDYISASSTNGTLMAGQQKVITFAVDSQMASGSFTGELVLKSSYGDETLPMALRVMCAPPDWKVDQSKYLYNMSFSVALDIEEILSDDKYDMVSGYINGEIRGVARIQYIASLNKHIAFLSVYGNDVDINKKVKFKVWDASACKLYELCRDSFPFVDNGQVGTPLVEDTIHTLDILVRKLQLNKGWNWVSFNLRLANDSVANVLAAVQYPKNGLIKSQTKYSQYFSTLKTWVGSLDTIRETEMYQIKLDSAKNLDFFGRPIKLGFGGVEIPIKKGWNWISYLPQVGMSPNIALGSLVPFNGDIIKNQYIFAQYVAGFAWIGNLSYMNPPSGFLYKSSVTGTLIYPETATSGNKREQNNESELQLLNEFEKSNINPNQYSGNMSVIGAAIQDGHQVTGKGDKIYAYINGELRGVSESIEFNGYYDFFVTIYGNENDATNTISFKYYNAQTEELSTINEELIYTENAVIGLVQEEQPLTLGTVIASGLDDINTHTLIF